MSNKLYYMVLATEAKGKPLSGEPKMMRNPETDEYIMSTMEAAVTTRDYHKKRNGDYTFIIHTLVPR